ncbi:Vicilin-like protein [Quillaja saponaria]|uniref:Vicilin-like protein n=1 Tax=Quillaja saponaria TaxID=32244 RepID=A0AAD7QEF5_QUISA|nr:Vicilin-like protein [Quillaja saponaria]
MLIEIAGKPTITYVSHRNSRESFNLEPADVLIIPAGSLTFVINQENEETLRIANLDKPLNNPVEFQHFFASGRENPESCYRVFSTDILEASFNTPREELERTLFGEQRQRKVGEGRQGEIIRASEEQIRALSQQASSTSRREGRPTEFSRPINLRSLKTYYSNEFGQFFEVWPEEFAQFRELICLSVSLISNKNLNSFAKYLRMAKLLPSSPMLLFLAFCSVNVMVLLQLQLQNVDADNCEVSFLGGGCPDNKLCLETCRPCYKGIGWVDAFCLNDFGGLPIGDRCVCRFRDGAPCPPFDGCRPPKPPAVSDQAAVVNVTRLVTLGE